MVQRIRAREAAALWLQTQGFYEDPKRRAAPAALRAVIRKLGYVQLDSIQTVARAHDLTLHARLHNYRPQQLQKLAYGRRELFEGWVHDAAIIPAGWERQWQSKFRLHGARRRARLIAAGTNWPRFAALCRRVRARIAREGPLPARAFADTRAASGAGWWDWKPAKHALEHLWRTGKLAVCARENFHKHYELTERYLPQLAAAKALPHPQYIDWACGEALARLAFATPRELADYWGDVSAAQARAWCARAQQRGALQPVEITAAADGGGVRRAFAAPGWRRRMQRALAAAPPAGVRLLSPFDPLLRDRARLMHLFGFAYRFEAFIPQTRRRDGYYVMPLWRGARPVGRVDPKFNRRRDALVINALRLEEHAPRSRAFSREIEQALEELRRFLGAARVEWRCKI